MQGARNAKETTKESAANMAASAKAGVEKTKASAQEKVDRMTTHDPLQKGMAADKKQERKHAAEAGKQESRENNAAAKQMNERADAEATLTSEEPAPELQVLTRTV